jgi:hypothetical protein
MKQIKTINGIKVIDDWSMDLVPVQLQDILEEHRAVLISKLVKGLNTYIASKFKQRPDELQLERIKEHLFRLSHSKINLDNYNRILEKVLNNENVHLDSELFYIEIDSVINSHLNDSAFCNLDPSEPVTFNYRDLIRFNRKQLVFEMQTIEGLKKHINRIYGVKENDQAKIIYLLEELREHFKKEPTDYTWLYEMFRENNLVDVEEGNLILLDEEISKLLDKHYNARVHPLSPKVVC